jgi:hypothetical protein
MKLSRPRGGSRPNRYCDGVAYWAASQGPEGGQLAGFSSGFDKTSDSHPRSIEVSGDKPWHSRKLSRPARSTAQTNQPLGAIGDWHYWVAQGLLPPIYARLPEGSRSTAGSRLLRMLQNHAKVSRLTCGPMGTLKTQPQRDEDAKRIQFNAKNNATITRGAAFTGSNP